MKVILRSTLHLILCLVLYVSAHGQLQSLSTYGGLTPAFSPDVYNYSRVIGPRTGTITLNFTVAAGTTVKINGVNVSTLYYTVNANGTPCTLEVTAANGVKSVYTIQMPMLSLTLNITNATCGKNDGAVSAIFNNATEPYTIRWYDANYNAKGIGTSTSGLAPGGYWCNAVLSDGSGSFVSTYFTVGVNNTLAINGVKTDVTCAGAATGQVALSPSGGTAPYTYLWSNGTTDATAGNLASGVYSVTVNDAAGCTRTGSFTITQPNALSATTTSTGVTCNGAKDGKASVSPAGGTAPYTYTWTNANSTSSSVSTLGAGTYSCTIKDKNGCTLKKDFTINEPTAITASAVQADVTCYGLSNGSVALTPTGGTPGATGYTYVWAPAGGTLATAKNLAAGNYSCEIKDSRGCKINQSFAVAQPVAALTATTTSTVVSCHGGGDGTATINANGGTAPYTYLWTGKGITGKTATGLSATTHSYNVTDDKGCTFTGNVAITQPAAALATVILQAQTSCAGLSRNKASVTASGGTAPYSYKWLPLGGNNTVTTELPAGDYAVTITDSKGCTLNKAITLVENPLPTVSPITGKATVLVNGSTTLDNNVTGGRWSSSNTGVAIVSTFGGLVTGVAPGTAIITYTVSNGVCENKTTHQIQVNPLPPQTSIAGGPASFTNQQSASFYFSSNVSSVTYQASVDSSVFITVPNPFTISGLTAGNHTLSVRAVDSYGTTGPVQGVYKWTVDIAPPTGSIVINANAVYTNKTTVTLAVTAGDDNGAVEAAFSNDGKAYSEYAAVSPEKTWELNSGDGNKTVYVQLRDKAGNTSVTTASIWLDRTAPAVPVITQPAHNSSINNTLPVVKGTAEADAAVAVYVDGTFAATVHSNAGENWQYPTIHPLRNGAHEIKVKATDKAGNESAFTNITRFIIDTTALTAQLSSQALQYVNAAFKVSIVFNKPVTDFDKNDLVVVNGVVSDFTSIDGSTYNATITPAADGEVIVSVTENAASDAAGNGNIASDTLVRKYDATRPTVTIATAAKNPLNKAFDITVTFSEAVTGFGKSGLTVENGAISSFTSIDATTYTATITPAVNGEVKVSVAENSASDAAGNGNVASDTLLRNYDATRPTVTVTTSAANPLNKAFDIAVTFSEAVTGFGKSGLTVENGAISSFTSIDATTYTATITPAVNGEVKVSVAENSASDAAGNGNIASDTLLRNYDATRPTVTVTTSAANPLNKAFDIAVTFSEAVTGFGKSGLTVENGAISSFTSIDATTYTATITPAVNGEVKVSVAENSASDAAGNGNIASDTLLRNYDATRPTVTVTTSAANPLNKAFDIAVAFSEAVTGFGKSDLVLENGAISSFTSIDATTYTATITPAVDGEVKVSVAENSASDAAGNGNIASDTLVRKYDATKPVATITTTATNPLNKAFDITVTFSEAVTGFGKSGFAVENGAVSGFTVINATTYTATITPAVNGEVKVSVAENSASDAAGNGNIASDTLVRKYDAARPTVTITTTAANRLNKSFDITVTFSEVVTGFGNSGLAVYNGAISGFTSIDATTYTATITPAVDGEVKVSVAENSASDAAGNGNIASDTLAHKYDATKPVATITSIATNPLNKAFDITVAFSEAVTGFGKSGFAVENGAVSGFTVINATTYTATITPAVDGEVKVSVAENSASDAAGNGNIASDTLVRKYDAARPTVTITTTAANPLNKAFDIAVTFSEAVTGFGKSGLTVENGAISIFTSIDATTYTATITPAVDGEVKVSVAEKSALDAAGNGNIASDALVRKYDATKPVATITSIATNPLNKAFDITVTFSEAVTGFGKSGFAVENGAVSGFTVINATTCTATITPAVDGEVKVSVAENSASDAAGNGNIASDTLVRKYDAARPTVIITTTAPNPLNKSFDITVTFSEVVTGFGNSGLAVYNGAISSFTSIDATTYTATITPAGDGEVKVSVAENSASDAAGNGNIASDTLLRNYDATRPTVTVTTSAANPLNGVFDVVVKFSEAVIGFNKAGLVVANGAVSGFMRVDATTYTATIVPAMDGEVKVSVAENSASDAAGNGNVASDTLVRKYDAARSTVTITTTAANPLNKAFDIAVTFSEAVTGFGKSGLVVENGAISSFTSIDATTYTATITPAADGEVKVSVAEKSALDAAGNGNIASDTLVRKYDAARSTVTITTTAANPLNKAFDIAVTFSEAVTGFGKSGLVVENGAISSFTSIDATTYTATITPAVDGEVKVSVAENAASDAAGNGNIASDTLVRKYDATRPMASIATTAANPLNKVFDVTVTFSEAVNGFGKSGLVVKNGAISSFTSIDATTYTATITPAFDGEVKVSVAENSASDAAGNGNVASDTLVRKYDATRPTVTIATAAKNPLNKAFDITVTFSEAVTGFGKSGLVVENGAISSFTSIDATTYTATITPAVDGEVKVSVAEKSALDAAGNGNIASDTLVHKYDAARPTVTITTTAANPLNKSFDIAVTFSEAVTGFGKSDFAVENGAVSGFTVINATTYTATITPAVDGEVKVSVAENSASDAAGNRNIASDTLVRKYDAARPKVTITTTAANPLNKPFDIAVTFSEAITGFGKSGLTVENGAISSFTSIDATTYAATITPAINGEVNISVAENAARDAAGNGNIASDTLLRNYDATRPTVTVTTAAANPLNGVFDVVVRFSEAVIGFNKAGLVVANGAVSGFMRVDATTYTATIVPAMDGEVKVSVAGNTAQDASGNGNIVSDALVRNYVAGKPIVTLSSASPGLLNNAFEVTVVFSRPVKGFDKAGLNVINATVSGFVSTNPSTYTATIAPVADGEVKVSVAESVALDTAGNGNLASDILVRTYDGTRPGVTISTAVNNPVNKAPLHFEINFTEEVSGLIAKNVTVTNGIVAKLEGAGKHYTLEVTPVASGPVTITLQENAVTDAAGNGNTLSNISSVVFDNVNATATIVAPAGVTAPYTATIYFSKKVSGFSVNKISISNATLSLFTKINDSVYSVLVTPVHEGQVEISVAAGVVLDAAGNINNPSAIVATIARFDAVIDQVYPVPANTVLNIRFRGITKEKMRVLLMDMKGNIVRDKEVPVQTRLLSLEVADLPSGIYYMMIPFIGNTSKTKIMIAR